MNTYYFVIRVVAHGNTKEEALESLASSGYFDEQELASIVEVEAVEDENGTVLDRETP